MSLWLNQPWAFFLACSTEASRSWRRCFSTALFLIVLGSRMLGRSLFGFVVLMVFLCMFLLHLMMNTHDNYAQSIFNTTPQLIATPPETSKIAHSDHLAD